MARPVFNAGHDTHASGFEFQQDVFERESRERLLAVIDSYGIVSGLGFLDWSTPGNPSLRVFKGLAYDGTGRRIKLSQAQVNAGISTVTGLTSADLNRILVVENATSGAVFEAHPITGELAPTKTVDYPVFSVVASGAVDPARHVRIGRFYLIVEGADAEAQATSTNGRDVLSFPKSSPFVVVGPTGDQVADFTGDDSTPFNDAFAQLAAQGGGDVVVRPGTYTIDPSQPISLVGLESVHVIGFGEGTVLVCDGPGSSPHWIVASCDEVTIENIRFQNSKHAAVSVRGVGKFTFRDNHLVGTNALGVHLVSGIDWAVVERNVLDQDVPVTFLGRDAGGGAIRALFVRGNDLVESDFSVNGEVDDLLFEGNRMDGGPTGGPSILRLGTSFSYLAATRSQPRRAIVIGNHMLDSLLVCAASGCIIEGNRIELRSTRAPFDGLIELLDMGTNAADYCVLADNVVVYAPEVPHTAASERVLGVYTDRSTIKGNQFRDTSATGWASAVEFFTSAADNVVDDNVFVDFVTPVIDNGTGNWHTVGTNNTSNKEL